MSVSSINSVSFNGVVRLTGRSVCPFPLIFLTICSCLVSDVVIMFLIGLLSERYVKLSDDGLMVRPNRSGATVLAVI